VYDEAELAVLAEVMEPGAYALVQQQQQPGAGGKPKKDNHVRKLVPQSDVELQAIVNRLSSINVAASTYWPAAVYAALRARYRNSGGAGSKRDAATAGLDAAGSSSVNTDVYD